MAFMGQDSWKSGLPSSALTKIEELESKADKLNRERMQRTRMVETLEQALEKQKKKVSQSDIIFIYICSFSSVR